MEETRASLAPPVEALINAVDALINKVARHNQGLDEKAALAAALAYGREMQSVLDALGAFDETNEDDQIELDEKPLDTSTKIGYNGINSA